MRINEVRERLDKYSKDQLRLIIVEIYKALPKAIKEDRDIDAIISNPDAFKKGKKKAKKKQEPLPDMDELEFDIEDFIENAYKQYYFAPNSVVHKRQRSKWRFVVKGYYKNLLAAAENQSNFSSCFRIIGETL